MWRVGFAADVATPERVEVLLNIALLVPFPLLGGVLWPALTWRDWTAYGFALALGAEVWQGLAFDTRSATYSDVVANTTGVFLGAVAATGLRWVVRALASPPARREGPHACSVCKMLAVASTMGGMAKSKVGLTVESLGDYLKEQRVSARLSLRQLAEQAGVSNPYLSQIERGLRKPSADVLQQIAKALRISAEQLYLRAGILSPEDLQGRSERSVELAVLADPGLSERQKQSLLDVYASFLALNTGRARTTSPRTTSPDPHHPPNRRSSMATRSPP